MGFQIKFKQQNFLIYQRKHPVHNNQIIDQLSRSIAPN